MGVNTYVYTNVKRDREKKMFTSWNTTNFLSGKFHEFFASVSTKLAAVKNTESYLQSAAELMIKVHQCPRLLQLVSSSHSCSWVRKQLLWGGWLLFSVTGGITIRLLCARKVPPSDGSIMKLQRERGRLSVKIARITARCVLTDVSEWAFDF